MKIFFSIISLFLYVQSIHASSLQPQKAEDFSTQTADSTRIAEIDAYWAQLAKTVREGDLSVYREGYHPDAVVVFAGNSSVPIEKALKMWEEGFVQTKAGDVKSDVEFLFTKRVIDETTAFETGMFKFSMVDKEGNAQNFYADLQALLVKKNGTWVCLMEYQKPAKEEDWNRLKKEIEK